MQVENAEMFLKEVVKYLESKIDILLGEF